MFTSPELRLFFSMCKTYPKKIGVSFLISMFEVLPDILTPIIMAAITGALVHYTPDDRSHVIWLCLAFTGNLLFNSCIRFPHRKMQYEFGLLISKTFLEKLHWHLLHLPPKWYRKQKQGSITNTLASVNYITQDLVETFFFIYPGQIVVLLGTVGYSVYQYGWIAAALIPMMFIASVISYYLDFKFTVPAFKTWADENNKLQGELADPIQCHVVVRDFKGYSHENHRVEKHLSWWSDIVGGALTKYSLGDSLSSLTGSFIFGGGLIASVFLFMDGYMGVEDVVYTNSLCLILRWYAKSIGDHVRKVRTCLAEMKPIQDIMSQSVSKLPVYYDTTDQNSIRFSHIRFRYSATARDVLKDVSFTIPGGSSVGIVGESGSGKTTLMRILLGNEVPDNGWVSIGSDIQCAGRVNGLFSHVQQDNILFHRTILENICYPNYATYTRRQAAERVCKDIGAHDFITNIPHGYDALVGDRGVNLSGGQRQRIAIARAILNKTPVLILDEATANLDAISEDEVIKTLDGRPKDQTLIVIAHRLKTVRDLDQIIVMQNGMVLGSGTHAELLKSVPYYRELCEKQNAV